MEIHLGGFLKHGNIPVVSHILLSNTGIMNQMWVFQDVMTMS